MDFLTDLLMIGLMAQVIWFIMNALYYLAVFTAVCYVFYILAMVYGIAVGIINDFR